MRLTNRLIDALRHNVLSRIFFVGGIIGMVAGPYSIYQSNRVLLKALDRFEKQEFTDEVVVDMYEQQYTTSRGHYRAIKVSDDGQAYPLILTDYQIDSVVEKGSVINKQSDSREFKIITDGQEFDLKIEDEGAILRIYMIVVFGLAACWTIFAPIVMSSMDDD
jgi:hypothetical protein